MDLAKLQIDAHIRSPWEAIDLGFAMARRWWWLAFVSWAVPALVVFTVSSVVFHAYGAASVYIVWWLKPLFDRGPLYVASRRLFDQTPSVREIIWALPGLYRADLVASLTWRRFSLTRSFDLPLTVLEGLKGDARTTRMSVLHRRYSGPATWLTLVLVHVEAVLIAGVFMFAYMMLPAFVEFNLMDWWLSDNMLTSWLYNVVYFFCIALVGPFYAIAGFALYISRRIELEAWDIEVRFRHLASRVTGRGGMFVSLVAPLLLVVLVQPVPPASADTTSDAVAEKAQAKALILEVKEDSAFHQMETVGSWRLKDAQSSEPDTIPQWLFDFFDFIAPLFGLWDGESERLDVLVSSLEVVAWVCFGLLLLWLVYRYRGELGELIKPPLTPAETREPPRAMFGLDIRRENLPDDIPGVVAATWRKGDHRAAISLLYRGLLSQLVHRHNFRFSDSDTEGECVEIVAQRRREALTAYTERITQCWQGIAYGHRVPSDATILALCDDWQKVFADA